MVLAWTVPSPVIPPEDGLAVCVYIYLQYQETPATSALVSPLHKQENKFSQDQQN